MEKFTTPHPAPAAAQPLRRFPTQPQLAGVTTTMAASPRAPRPIGRGTKRPALRFAPGAHGPFQVRAAGLELGEAAEPHRAHELAIALQRLGLLRPGGLSWPRRPL